MVDVTVVTTSIPKRFGYLAECMESVRNQTQKPMAHLVGIDYKRIGPSANLNRLINGVLTKWIAPLADDDLMYPQHIERLLDVAESTEADMVYPWCDVEGRGQWNPNAYLDITRLAYDNYIPATVLIKTDVVRELGGYADVVCEDHEMWQRLIANNKKIVCLPERTWLYRFHKDAEGQIENVSDGLNFWIDKDFDE